MAGRSDAANIAAPQAHCRAEGWPEASNFSLHLLTFAIRTLLIFATEDFTALINWCD